LYAYDDDEEGGRSRLRAAIGLGVVVVLAAVAWFVVRPALGDDEDASEGVIPIDDTASSTGSIGASTGSGDTPTGSSGSPTVSVVGGSTLPPSSTDGEANETTPRTEPPDEPTTTASRTATTGGGPTTSSATAVSSSGPTTSDAGPSNGPSYVTLPDGTPKPVLATFDVDTVTLRGAVPSRAASERLATLARANSRDPETVRVRNELTINPDVPISVGVQVIELTSSRFPPGSSEVLLPHAAELNRVATVMRVLPNVTVIVVGHADQIGDAGSNLALSRERAVAVVDYLIGQGVDGARLAARAVGEADLLSFNDDAIALALNRRTEFIFYGLLIE